MGWLFCIYAVVILLCSLPYMQKKLGDATAAALSEIVHSKVEVNSVDLGYFNRITINDIIIHEPNGDKMVSVGRASASIRLFELFFGKVRISNAQLFGTKAKFYRKTPDDVLNCQFLIDAFSSDEESKPLNLSIGSFIIRNADVTYDVLSAPHSDYTLDANHLNFSNFGANISVQEISNDSINLTIKRLQFKEKNSRLTLHDSQFSLATNKRDLSLKNCIINLPHSTLSIDDVYIASNDISNISSFSLQPTAISANLASADFIFLSPKLRDINESITLTSSIEGDDKKLSINELNIYSYSNALRLRTTGSINNMLSKNELLSSFSIQDLYINCNELNYLPKAFNISENASSMFAAIGTINANGNVEYSSLEGLISRGGIITSLGDIDYDVEYVENHINAKLFTDGFDIGALTDFSDLGSISLNTTAHIDLSSTSRIPSGNISGTINTLDYKGHTYTDADFNVSSVDNIVSVDIAITDEECNMSTSFEFDAAAMHNMNITLDADNIDFNALNLVNGNETMTLSLKAEAHTYGKDIDNLLGNINITDLTYTNNSGSATIENLSLKGTENGASSRLYTIDSDFINGTLEGQLNFTKVIDNVKSILHSHIGSFITDKNTFPYKFNRNNGSDTDFTYAFRVTDSPILHLLYNKDFFINKEASIEGKVSSINNSIAALVSVPEIRIDETIYNNVSINICSDYEALTFQANGKTYVAPKTYKDLPTISNLILDGVAKNNTINANIDFKQDGKNNIDLTLHPVLMCRDSLGSNVYELTIEQSNAQINDTTWVLTPSKIDIFNNKLACKNFKAYSKSSTSSLSINGITSDNPDDSLVIRLKDMPIDYVTDAINFHSVYFGGKASGDVVLKSIIGDEAPELNATLSVDDFILQGGSLGQANIKANWDKEIGGVVVDGRMVDVFDVPDGNSKRRRTVTGITTCTGYIAPGKRGILLNVNTHNTNASFLKGWIGSIFNEIEGTVTGPLTVIQTSNQFDLLGDIVPNLNLNLAVTNMNYHIENDTLRFRPDIFQFDDITIADKYGKKGKLDVKIHHHRLGNFGYEIDGALNGLCVYDEHEFNSDKFYATLFAKGDLKLTGYPDKPLTIDANISTQRGSIFAYDASTPDAIIGTSFIEFHDKEEDADSNIPFDFGNFDSNYAANYKPHFNDSIIIAETAKKNYHGDIKLNFNIDLTPDCEVKLKMDNIDDGFMSTRGNAKLLAQWYNKGAFQLYGDYNIESGSYRMYLHDLIFRDLSLQRGSKVEFNGNPFDANINLICHHTLNSVPLNDLTLTSSLTQSTKAKVICMLDISGTLDNMNFTFDMDMPNVSEEIRQLVRSLMSTEEEKNSQILYLLGVGRFYPNEYARSSATENSGLAVNSLLSSTLSGQINQMFSNMLGRNSNWSIGSMLATGEKGWDDLDVEGTLSGRMLDDRLLVNGNIGYRDNAITNKQSFIGDFEVKWRMLKDKNIYLKAYNLTNDRYFTKSTINTQGVGISLQHDFESIRKLLKKKSND